jgi:adenine-specific DNA methylase
VLQVPLERRMEALLEPEKCREVLNNYAGNVQAFAEYFSMDSREQQWIMFTAENLMANSHLHGQWKAAIKTNQIVRLRNLQHKALTSLEDLSSDENMKAAKFADHMNLAKLVLNDFIAGQVMQAKAKEVTTTSSVVQGEDEDEDEALERARNA